jgi:hypothetical protein
MSWSVSASGKCSDVAVDIAGQFTKTSPPCEEPEEGIRQAAAKLIAQALLAYNALTTVLVNAHGSYAQVGDVGRKTYADSLPHADTNLPSTRDPNLPNRDPNLPPNNNMVLSITIEAQ